MGQTNQTVTSYPLNKRRHQFCTEKLRASLRRKDCPFILACFYFAISKLGYNMTFIPYPIHLRWIDMWTGSKHLSQDEKKGEWGWLGRKKLQSSNSVYPFPTSPTSPLFFINQTLSLIQDVSTFECLPPLGFPLPHFLPSGSHTTLIPATPMPKEISLHPVNVLKTTQMFIFSHRRDQKAS